MGVWIQCCKRTEVQDSLARRENMRVDPFASKFHSRIMLVVQMTRQWMCLISVEQNPGCSLFICNQIIFSAFSAFLFNLNTVLFSGILNNSLPPSVVRPTLYRMEQKRATCHSKSNRHLSTFARSFNSGEQFREYFHLETQQ